jgi:hypothetical protein
MVALALGKADERRKNAAGVAVCRMAAIRGRGLSSGRRARTMLPRSRDPWDAEKRILGNAVQDIS